MEPLKVILVDDEQIYIDELREKLKHYKSIQIIDTFNDPFKAKKQIEKLKPDALFLDIKMDGLSGIRLAREVKQWCSNVIFLTNYTEYVPEVLDDKPIHFIGKRTSTEFGTADKYIQQAINLLLKDRIVIKKVVINSLTKFSICLFNGETEHVEDFAAGKEVYNAFYTFIASELLGVRLHHQLDKKIISNLNQSKKALFHTVVAKFNAAGMHCGEERLFKDEKSFYALNIESAEEAPIRFNLNYTEMDTWGEKYLARVIEEKRLAEKKDIAGYGILDTRIIILKKQDCIPFGPWVNVEKSKYMYFKK